MENRISSITKLASGDCANPVFETRWDFSYDGDGGRVATLTTSYTNGLPQGADVTLYYFGGAYEVRPDDTAVKYYSFGGQMIGMNSGAGMQYFLTDHLGSIVAVTNANGDLVSQQRYLPPVPRSGIWRNQGTNKLLTYSTNRLRLHRPARTRPRPFGRLRTSMGGLMDYKARFYSPYLMRFIQPDTLIPNPASSQSWNRFAYVGNNPVNFNDPTGHKACDGAGIDGGCDQSNIASTTMQMKVDLRKSFGVKTNGKFNDKQVDAIYQGVYAVGEKFAGIYGGSAGSAFKRVFNKGVSFVFNEKCDGCRPGIIEGTNRACGSDYVSRGCVPGGGLTTGLTITFASFNGENVNNVFKMTLNVVHELGHVYFGNKSPNMSKFSRDALIPNSCDGCYEYQEHPPSMNANGEDIDGELLGDTFIAWIYSAWNPLNIDAVSLAQGEMDRLLQRP